MRDASLRLRAPLSMTICQSDLRTDELFDRIEQLQYGPAWRAAQLRRAGGRPDLRVAYRRPPARLPAPILAPYAGRAGVHAGRFGPDAGHALPGQAGDRSVDRQWRHQRPDNN